MKSVLVEIYACRECPHYLDRTYCTHSDFKEWQFLPNPGGDGFPDWCPLVNKPKDVEVDEAEE